MGQVTIKKRPREGGGGVLQKEKENEQQNSDHNPLNYSAAGYQGLVKLKLLKAARLLGDSIISLFIFVWGGDCLTKSKCFLKDFKIQLLSHFFKDIYLLIILLLAAQLIIRILIVQVK